jgi:hypothetical protein
MHCIRRQINLSGPGHHTEIDINLSETRGIGQAGEHAGVRGAHEIPHLHRNGCPVLEHDSEPEILKCLHRRDTPR